MTETSTYKSADFNSTQLEIDNFPHELSIQTHGKSDLVSNMILKDKLWEAYETQLMIKHLKLGNNVLDIGGNIGYYTLIASKLIGEQGKVFTFEPEPQNFRLLKENINIINSQSFNKTTNRRIAACIPMHTFGHPCRIDEIKAIYYERLNKIEKKNTNVEIQRRNE
jgi:predicted methyltransferase